MSSYVLNFALPADPADCLADELVPLIVGQLWVGYLTFQDIYLADVNDNPELEADYDDGIGLWPTTVAATCEAMASSLGGGPISRRRATGRGWVDDGGLVLDPELIEGLTIFGADAVIWSTEPEAVPGRSARWWATHGYKEPFLAGCSPELDLESVADIVAARIELAVRVTDERFVPHRVRVHRRWLAPGEDEPRAWP